MQLFLSFARKFRGLLLAALFAFYFGTLWIAALHFPKQYDWQRNVISNLLSPRDNPAWYWLPSVGVALAGICMAPLAAWIDSELAGAETPRARRVRRVAFAIGIGCLVLAAVVAPRHGRPLLGIRHPHEFLARTSAVGLGLGMLCACRVPAAEGRLRAVRNFWRIITAPALGGAIGSGLVVGMVRLRVVGPGAAEFFRGTIFWHLGFWEWIGSAAVFLFFAAAVVGLRSQ